MEVGIKPELEGRVSKEEEKNMKLTVEELKKVNLVFWVPFYALCEMCLSYEVDMILFIFQKRLRGVRKLLKYNN